MGRKKESFVINNMGKNLEVKIKVDSHKQYLEKAKNLDYSDFFALNQTDYYFENSSGLLKLRVMPEKSELIFYNRDEKNPDRWSNYEILNLNNEDNPLSFLKNILKVTTIVAKHRSVYIFKNTRIHFDEVENLGNFIELETVVENDLEDAKKRFNYLVNYLELDLKNQIKKSYKNLMEEK